MAEFKLGRIRFIWKNNWASTTVYYKDDIVRNGGNTYVCIKGHTAPTLFSSEQATYWDKISDGTDWKSAWTINTLYKINDIVKYGGYLYVANAEHTSSATLTLGLEADQSKWDLYAEGFDYKQDWVINTRYKINDIAKYNGTTYICITPHTSSATNALGLEADQAKWQIFTEGFNWTNTWATDTRYRKNDIARYGGTLYVANTGHTSAANTTLGLEADQSKWDYLHKGIEYRNDWVAATRYRINDVVKYGGGVWICTTQHTSSATNLAADESNWAQFVEGLEFEDGWAIGTAYQPGDFVTYGGYSYVAITNNVGLKPSDNAAAWDLFTTGFRWVGDYDVNAANLEYIEGDVARVGGYTYLCILKHTSQHPPNATYWQRLNEGFEWKGTWADGTLYDAGDSVQHGVNSYICVLAHTADETTLQNRPDQDSDGSEWNLVNAGAESGNLTTAGDIVYYGGAGATRLPVGSEGQGLRVNAAGNAPEWAYLGQLNNIFYVEADAGVDGKAPNYGVTLDRPFKTIRHATEQVQAGAIRFNAKTLLQRNRHFIQDEVIEFINANNADTATATTASTDAITITDTSWLVANETAIKFAGTTFGNIVAGTEYFVKTILNATTFTVSETKGGALFALADGTGTSAVSLSYLEASCRRDTGQVLDAVIWDLSHGGNERSVKAAKSYYAADGTTYLGGANATQTAAGFGYIVTLADAVMSNVAPSTVRGSLARFTDAALIEESDATTVVTTLTGIVTAAITAGNTTAVPAIIMPQHTIFVKTGSFAEVLPIVVPENTAIVGDELRSTRISPAGTLTAAGDTTYSLDAYARMAVVMSDIVTNTSITKTTGNALTQVTTSPAGSAGAGATAAGLWQQIYDYVDYRVNGVSGDSTIPVTEGANLPNTTTEYTYAVETIEANRAFIIAEVHAYIADQHPSYTYSIASCTRDINRYLDAIQYDLIYTGNYKSLLYARYYANSVYGSTAEDMFYMRNGTGLRNCTITGLAGTLGSDNAYGTKRPSAGAFVSLDPGWGPAHIGAWIANKSPYVQNVTTFGTGCVGLKIDGDLHDSGNDSIVANDFTQIISDGIGCWVTNLGRAELVSVFSYYGHIGYLAENGGKIRATNGNSSYGKYGTVAEGVDSTETPVTGKIDNFAVEAFSTNVLTDDDDILVIEWTNAGVGYTAGGTTITPTGEGYGAVVNAVQTTNGGVFEVRLLNPSNNKGGTGYVTNTNVAQDGSNTQITISNTDVKLSAAYLGMAIYITGGTGAGQYAYIDTYNSGTKVATVKKMSDDSAGWDHVTGVAIESVLDATTTYSIEPRVTFTAPADNLYASTTKGRAYVEDGKIILVTIWDTGVGYSSAPTMTLTDPSNTVDVPHEVRIGNGVLNQPTWTNRGTGFASASVTVVGDGYADLFQPGTLINVSGLTALPQAGSNFTIAGNNNYYKLVAIRNTQGSGPYTAQFQISPAITITDAPADDVDISVRIRYSQVRLTGHDFLDVGTGNFASTNYPGTPAIAPIPANETVTGGGGRVFYTTTDQDGNFRVGGLFNVEQATGVATLNADAFNITGLNELQLGAVALGGTGATITEFSVDGTFTANSDAIVPTQKAIKTYIASQIGGGAGELNVNSMTAGVIKISGQEITTTTLAQINITQKVNFTGGIKGAPVALNYFLSS